VISIYLAVFITSLLLSFILTWYVRNIAVSRGWVIAPPSARHLHTIPLPRLGGVAIVLSFMMVIGFLVMTSILFDIDMGFSPRTVLWILVPSILIFLLGLYDDIHSVNPYAKFAIQSVAAVLLFFGGFRVFQLPLFGAHNLGWFTLPLTIFWVLWITNAFNLIDGLDGLAAGSALFSTMTVFTVSLISQSYLVSLLTLGLAGAILGFLRFNFNPATIFLGDCGSLFIGFMLSALALVGSQKTPTIVAVAIPVVSFGLPILDTTLSVLRRFLRGQSLFAADREHIHHKLLEQGLSQRQVVIILYGVSALFGLLSLFLLYPGGGMVGVVLFVLGVGVWIGVQHLGYPEFIELRRVAQRAMVQKQIIINNLAVRRAAEKLSKVQDLHQLRRVVQDAFEANDFDGFMLTIAPPGDGEVQVQVRARSAISGRPSVLCEAQDPQEFSAIREMVSSVEEQRDGQCWSWHKSMSTNRMGEGPVPKWALTLELITTKGQKCGFFSLYRACTNRPLLVDVNIIASEFHVALADAIYRVMNQAESENAT